MKIRKRTIRQLLDNWTVVSAVCSRGPSAHAIHHHLRYPSEPLLLFNVS